MRKIINATETEAMYFFFFLKKKGKITQKLAIQQRQAWKTKMQANLNSFLQKTVKSHTILEVQEKE